MADSKSFDWNDHPIEGQAAQQAAQASIPVNGQDNAFNWNDHPIQPVTAAQMNQSPSSAPSSTQVSAGRAALVGAGQGATFGLADEINAVPMAAVGMLDKNIPTLPGEHVGEGALGLGGLLSKYQRLMQTSRDVARDEQQAGQEQHPLAYTAGAVGGGLLAPGLGAAKAADAVKDASLLAKIGTGIGTGAALGGLNGFGEGTGSITDRLPTAIQGAKIGAAAGGVLGGAAATLQGVAKAADTPIIADSIEAFNRGANGEDLITKTGRKVAANAVRDASEGLYTDLKALQKKVGGEIGARTDAAEESGTKIDMTQDIQDVLDKLKTIQQSGSKEAANHAASIEAEIKQILKIKSPQAAAEDISKIAPEGFITPEQMPVDAPKYEVGANQAKDLKNVLGNYGPRPGIAPQEVKGAGVAQELADSAGDKLADVTGVKDPTQVLKEVEGGGVTLANDGASLNEQYSAVKNALERLNVNETALPEKITDKINNIVSKYSNSNAPGDTAEALINDVVENIRQVDPDMADKYAKILPDVTERLALAQKTNNAGHNAGLITAGSTGAANLAGLVANKTGLAAAGGAVKNFAQAVLPSLNVADAAISGDVQHSSTLAQIKSEPYQFQRKVAQAAENADPDTLKSQAQNIRTKYGNQGNQLATILDNMSAKDKDSRRALMFTVMQNKAYRNMLGMSGDESGD